MTLTARTLNPPRPPENVSRRYASTSSPGTACVSHWDDDTRCDLRVSDEGPLIHISANVAGLQSLARHCLTLAQDGVDGVQHVDFDADGGWFETTAFGLRIE